MKYLYLCLALLLTACGGSSDESAPTEITKEVGNLLNAGNDVNKSFDDETYTQLASDGNGGVLSYSSSDVSIATVDNASGEVTFISAGQVTITAYEAESANYLAQNDSYVLTISKGIGQALLAGSDVTKTWQDTSFTHEFSGGNGGVISYVSENEDVATVNGSTGEVTIVDVGETLIHINEEESASYLSQTDSYLLKVNKVPGIPLDAVDDMTSFVGDVFTQVVEGGNDGAMTYTSNNEDVAIVDLETGEVSAVGVGEAVITISEAETHHYFAQNAKYKVVVTKGHGNALDAGADVVKVYGDSTFIQLATGGNGGKVAYSSSDASIAAVNSETGQVTITGSGQVVITATESETDNHLSQMDSYNLTVNKGLGIPLFAGQDLVKSFGDVPFTQVATGGNGGVITYSSNNSSVGTVNASTGEVTIVGSGTVTITATEAFSKNYLAQSDSYVLVVSKATGTSLNAGMDISKSFGDSTFTQSATGGNGGVITYSSSDSSIATVNGSTGEVTIVGSGSVIITANEAESSNFSAQTDSYTLTVGKGAGTSLEAGADVVKTYGDNEFIQLATGGNGGVITYSSSDSAIATVDSLTGEVTIVKSGTAIITATEEESDNYTSQNDSYTLTVKKATGVALEAGLNVVKTFDNDYFLQKATGGNGGVISYASSDTSIATVDTVTGELTIFKVGTVTITATEAETDNYLSQSDSYDITISKSLGIKLDAGPDITKTMDDSSFTQLATGGNGGTVSYQSSDTSVATVDGVTGVVTIVSAGTVTITVNEAESGNYFSQTDNYVLMINKGSGVPVEAGDDISKAVGDPSFKQLATGGNGGELVYSSSDDSIASIDSATGELTILSVGTVIITVTELESENYISQWDSFALEIEEYFMPVVDIASSYFGFAAVREDGSTLIWGERHNGFISELNNYFEESTQIERVQDEFAYTQDGAMYPVSDGVHIYDDWYYDYELVEDEFNGDINVIDTFIDSLGDYYTLKENGELIGWGRDINSVPENKVLFDQTKFDGTIPVVEVYYENLQSMAALRSDGSLVTWGPIEAGGDSSSVASEIDGTNPIKNVYHALRSFLVEREDGTFVTWGHEQEVSNFPDIVDKLHGEHAVISIHSDSYSYAALMDDGSVLIWGKPDSSTNTPSQYTEIMKEQKIVKVFEYKGNGYLFEMEDGSIDHWGSRPFIDNALSAEFNSESSIKDVILDRNFGYGYGNAVLKENGDVIVWGMYDRAFGKKEYGVLELPSPAVKIQYIDRLLIAFLENGGIYVWGNVHSSFYDVEHHFQGGDTKVLKIVSKSSTRFAALLDNGRVITWGEDGYGSDSSSVKEYINP